MDLPQFVTDEQIIMAHLGEDGLVALVRAFYRRVPNDDVLGPIYAAHIARTGETLEHAEERLRDFLLHRFAGAKKYTLERGHPRLRMRHMAFSIDAPAARRWVEIMRAAMDEVAVAPEARRRLDPYFEQTAMFMVNRGETDRPA